MTSSNMQFFKHIEGMADHHETWWVGSIYAGDAKYEVTA